MESKTELLRTQSELITELKETNTENKHSSELIKIRHIANTPFTIVYVDENKSYFIAMGNARLSDYMNSDEDCVKMIEEKSYELIMAMCGRIATLTYNDLKLNNND